MAMNMNREQKRMLRRAGYLDASGEPVQTTKPRTTPQAAAVNRGVRRGLALTRSTLIVATERPDPTC